MRLTSHAVSAREIEFAGDEKEHGARRREARVAARLALCSLKQAVDGVDVAVGPAALRPGNDAVEVPANQTRDVRGP